MHVFQVPVDPPPSLTSSQAIPFDLAYKTGDLSSDVKNDLDYAAWFRRTFTRLITDECPGRAGEKVTTLRSQIVELQDRLVAAKGDATARDRAIQEEIVGALAREREYW